MKGECKVVITTIYPTSAGCRKRTAEGYMKNAGQNPYHCGAYEAGESSKSTCEFTVYVVYHKRNSVSIWAFYICYLLGMVLVP